MTKKVVDQATSTYEEFAKSLWWKASQCPSCAVKDGWRIGEKWCLDCVEWRPVKPLLKKQPFKLVKLNY